jgi:hypothetical protein
LSLDCARDAVLRFQLLTSELGQLWQYLTCDVSRLSLRFTLQ